jgi:hypothetical protein
MDATGTIIARTSTSQRINRPREECRAGAQRRR